MASLGTVEMALQGAELCLSIGKAIAKVHKAITTAEKDIAERLLQINSYWVRLESQIKFLHTQRVLNRLGYERRINFERLLAQLAAIFQQAELIFKALEAEQDPSSLVPEVAKPSTKATKLKYAVRHRKQLETITDDLRKWYSLFDASWFELALQSSHQWSRGLSEADVPKGEPIELLASLKAAMEQNEGGAANIGAEPYRFLDKSYLTREKKPISSSLAIVTKEARAGGLTVIVDRISVIPEADQAEVEKDIAKLARTLSAVDPLSFGLLLCLGVIRPSASPPASNTENGPRPLPKEKPYDYQFIFAWPERCRNPMSLRGCLSGSIDAFPLHRRFEIAKSLAKSVMYVHNARLVHKGIRPENILLFKESGDGYTTSFLIGFEQFRPAERDTFRRGDMVWERNLYRHPDRQGLYPAQAYRMEHDIYSLGVCLLEIGLWTSFTITKKEESAVPEVLTRLARAEKLQDAGRRAVHTKQTLLAMADQTLPGKMGEIYTEVVKSCLSCLDDAENQLSSSSEQDGSNQEIGLGFIADVTKPRTSI